MRLLTATTFALSTLTLSTNAAWLLVNNYCKESLWISDANRTDWTPPAFELKSAVSYITKISGQGNQLGASKVADYYNDKTPRFILGTSTDNGRLWWSVNHIGGDPFEGQTFNVTTPIKECGSTTVYNTDNHNCPDGDFTVDFNACYENAG